MLLKLMGAIMVVASCSGFGILMAFTYKREVRSLDALLRILEWMINDLRFKMTPLPELCRISAGFGDSTLRSFFLKMEREMNKHTSPDAASCASAALSSTVNISPELQEILKQLGCSLGQFDAEGQIQCLESVRLVTEDRKSVLCKNMSNRLRSYQTLGLCAGAALAILLV
ncbi:MAG: stage III sporulation protein AB [Oscillospiraceae bacterium]|nr:stage III sporulation protein AB [Oscillospiraceae bacterium]